MLYRFEHHPQNASRRATGIVNVNVVVFHRGEYLKYYSTWHLTKFIVVSWSTEEIDGQTVRSCGHSGIGLINLIEKLCIYTFVKVTH